MLPSELKAAIDDAYRNAAQQPRLIAEEGEILTSEFEISLQVLCAAIQTGKYPIATYHAQAEIVRVSREIARRFMDSFTTSDKAAGSSQQPATPAP